MTISIHHNWTGEGCTLSPNSRRYRVLLLAATAALSSHILPGIDPDTVAYVIYENKQKPNNNTTEEVEITMRFYLDI